MSISLPSINAKPTVPVELTQKISGPEIPDYRPVNHGLPQLIFHTIRFRSVSRTRSFQNTLCRHHLKLARKEAEEAENTKSKLVF